MELTVVVAIIVALAAVVIPMVGQAKRDGQVAEVLQLIDSVRNVVPFDKGSCLIGFRHHVAIRDRLSSAPEATARTKAMPMPTNTR